MARTGEQSMRSAPGVNGVPSEFEDLLSGSSAPMFAVGCHNCHCLLFFCRDAKHHTHSSTSNEGRTPRALDDARTQLGEGLGLVLSIMHAHTYTYSHHIMAQGDTRLRLGGGPGWLYYYYYIHLLG